VDLIRDILTRIGRARSRLRLTMTPVVLLMVALLVLLAFTLRVGTRPTEPRVRAAPPPLIPGFPACGEVTQPFSLPTTLDAQWSDGSPSNATTFDLTGVTSTAYPAATSPNSSVFSLGDQKAALRTCFVGGILRGRAVDTQTWEYYHANDNAACLRMVALEWMQVRNLRCDNVEDGFRPRETRIDANNARMYVAGTYFTRVRDDCLENDGVIGGILYDNLWEQCTTGISERPSTAMGSWSSPANETLTLDHMLIGLYETPHVDRGIGENALFKWSSSANRLVIKCSIFQVDSVSLNGPNAMAIPHGTVIDDRDCPHHPSTIVWTGAGSYPAPTAGLPVSKDAGVWDAAVAKWKCMHGYTPCPASS
jgi:hypothetical protein